MAVQTTAELETAPAEGATEFAREAPAPPTRSARQSCRLSMITLLVGLVVTAGLVWATRSASRSDESRLLKLEVDQAAATLAKDLPTIHTTLAAAQELATVTNANAARFRAYLAPDVGPKQIFASVSLWKLGGPSPRLVDLLGEPIDLASRPGEAQAFFAGVHPSRVLNVTRIMDYPNRRLGVAELPPAATTGLVVYAEISLPADRRLVVPHNSAFTDLNFALYLGRSEAAKNLLETSIPLPVPPLQARATVDFGNTSITMVGTPARSLDGPLLSSLVWIVAVVGILFSLAAALVTERLVRRRQDAENLAEENRRLYRQQRAVAKTLQLAMLPSSLPVMSGVEVAVAYVAGEEGIDVGGDWYDVVRIDDDHFYFVIGDVSGRGLGAATAMASLRHTIRAYAAQGDPPQVVLDKLGGCLDLGRDGHFATVLCGFVDVPSRRLSIASAGHLPALVSHEGTAKLILAPPSPPVGVACETPRCPLTISVPPGAIVIAVTDGIVERRGESLDTGLERLRQCAEQPVTSLEELLRLLQDRLVPQGSEDDIAMVGMRWTP